MEPDGIRVSSSGGRLRKTFFELFDYGAIEFSSDSGIWEHFLGRWASVVSTAVTNAHKTFNSHYNG